MVLQKDPYIHHNSYQIQQNLYECFSHLFGSLFKQTSFVNVIAMLLMNQNSSGTHNKRLDLCVAPLYKKISIAL